VCVLVAVGAAALVVAVVDVVGAVVVVVVVVAAVVDALVAVVAAGAIATPRDDKPLGDAARPGDTMPFSSSSVSGSGQYRLPVQCVRVARVLAYISIRRSRSHVSASVQQSRSTFTSYHAHTHTCTHTPAPMPYARNRVLSCRAGLAWRCSASASTPKSTCVIARAQTQTRP
jgi:hypothetical protein